MRNAKISVVIPIYNTEKYIDQCARSLFEQTLDSIEYIFVDDCSPDNSIGVLQKVLEDYPHRKNQVKIIRHETNQGIGAVRNHGVAVCTGDYIIHCDSDDWVDNDMYKAMYDNAVETNADMVYCDYFLSRGQRNKLVPHTGTLQSELFIEEMLYGTSHGALWNKLVKKHIALSPDIDCPDHIVMCEDLLRSCQMCKLCNTISYLNKGFYFYRQTATQTTRNWTLSTFQGQLAVILSLEKKFDQKYIEAFDHRRRILCLCAIKHRKITSQQFYNILHQIKSTCWSDSRINFIVKLIFFVGCKLYLIFPPKCPPHTS